MAKRFRLCAALSVLCLNQQCEVSAQNVVPTVEWERLYYGMGTGKSMIPSTVMQTSEGGYILAGGGHLSPSYADCILVKIDTRGEIQWDRSYGGSDRESIRFIRQTSDGGYIFAGISDSPVSGDKEAPPLGGEDVWVVKVDGSGNKQWDRSFGGAGRDAAEGIWQGADGYTLAGSSLRDDGRLDYWLIKLHDQGEQVSSQRLGSENIYLITDIKQTGDGGYVLTGVTGYDTPHFGDGDGWLMKVDANGIKQWETDFGGTGHDLFSSVDVIADGGFIMGGRSDSPPSGNKESPQIGADDYWIVKADAAGNKVWDRTYGTVDNDGVRIVRQAAESGYVFVGNLYVKTEVIKFDANGNRQWRQVFGTPDDRNRRVATETTDFQVTRDGGYVICGPYRDPSADAPVIYGSLVAKLERVVSRAGQVVSWKADAGAVLETVEDLGGEWAVDENAVLSIGEAKAVVVAAGGQRRFYRLRATDGASSLPALAPGALLSWPVDLNQTLEVSPGKDGPWQNFSGDQGENGETNYAIVPQELQQRYFRTRRSSP